MSRTLWNHLNKKGFTLIEMLIAVSVLSLLGVVVIQVFITASSLNHKAADMDRAVAASTAVVERMKSLPSGSELDIQTIGSLFPDAVVSIGVDGLEGSVSQMYSGEWEPMSMASSQLPGFVLDAQLKAGSSKLGDVTLLTIKVTKQGRYFHKSDPLPLLFELEAALPQPIKGGAR
jgi:prepilin-type N-terminal cleavage/methylation domain-containing protein